MNKIKSLLTICVATVLLCALTAHAQKDAALVTTVAGESTWQGASGKSTTVQSFMKLREGDRTDIKANGKLNLVYLESGEVEQWDGPANFVIGSTRTQNITSGKPVTRKLPLSMVERIARAPEVVNDIRNRSGMTVTRSFIKSEAAERARSYRPMTSRRNWIYLSCCTKSDNMRRRAPCCGICKSAHRMIRS